MYFTEILPNITSNVISALISAALIALAAKVTFEKWKKVAFGITTTVITALVTAFIVFGAITAVNEFNSYRQRNSLQEKINQYTKGHYPDAYEGGYTVEVMKIDQRVLLAFIYPEDKAYPNEHPLSTQTFSNQIRELLNDNGYPGEPGWGYEMKALSEKQLETMLQRK